MTLTAERLDRIQPSLTIAISTVARKMIADGKNVISLSRGEPDFDTPRNIKDAAIRAIEAGESKYTDVSGTPAPRRGEAGQAGIVTIPCRSDRRGVSARSASLARTASRRGPVRTIDAQLAV